MGPLNLFVKSVAHIWKFIWNRISHDTGVDPIKIIFISGEYHVIKQSVIPSHPHPLIKSAGRSTPVNHGIDFHFFSAYTTFFLKKPSYTKLVYIFTG